MAVLTLARPRMIRNYDKPLTLSQIEEAAPAVFASEPHAGRSSSYAYVPTIQVLHTFLDNGFGVYEAAQQRSRDEERDPYTKHMLRLRYVANWTSKDQLHGGIPELVLVNAHDGTAAYWLVAGFFKIICTNGLMVGKNITSYRVRHTTADVTRSEVLSGGMEIVSKQFKTMVDMIGSFTKVIIPYKQKLILAEKALRLRYGDVNAPFLAAELIKHRRLEDEGDDAWTVYNVIQENLMKGGFETRSTMYSRRSVVRPVERVSSVIKINQGLWDLIEDLVAELS